MLPTRLFRASHRLTKKISSTAIPSTHPPVRRLLALLLVIVLGLWLVGREWGGSSLQEEQEDGDSSRGGISLLIHQVIKEGGGEELVLNNPIVAKELSQIIVSPGDSKVRCNTLLDCTLFFVKRLRTLPRVIDGSLVVALGGGRGAYAINYPRRQFAPAKMSIVRPVLIGAHSTTHPTIFHISAVDSDIFSGYDGDCVSNEHSPFVLSKELPFLFFLTPSTAHLEYGMLWPNLIPIPDPHSLDKQKGVAKCKTQPTATEKVLSNSPAKVVFYGATTGRNRPYSRSERYQVVEQLLGSNVSECYFSGVVQDIQLPSGLQTQEGRPQREWGSKGRYFVDVDGNSNSWDGLLWKLCSGNPVLKVNSTARYVQWYYHMLEHGKHIHVVDAFHGDLEDEINKVIHNVSYAAMLAYNAAEFCCTHLTLRAQAHHLQSMIATVWESHIERIQRDWRVRNTTPSLPLIRNSRPGPLKRIERALSVVDASNVPLALLRVAAVPDVRFVCVFGTSFTTTFSRRFWSSTFKSVEFSTIVTSRRDGGTQPCDLAVLLEDVSATKEEDVLQVLNPQYHVIITMTGTTTTTHPHHPNATVVARWPSVPAVVTQLRGGIDFRYTPDSQPKSCLASFDSH